jgi:carboxypeptidase C (cathepsin A)
MYTGYLGVNASSESRLFYTLYAAGGNLNANATVNSSVPLILWLQGGPGCADFASYFQNGPYNILWDENGNPLPVANGITWNDEYHMLYVDAPIGVGYSVAGSDLPNNSMWNGHQLETFLISFFEIYTSLKYNDFYILGDSFAGHFIPALATILVKNWFNNDI